MPAHSPAQGSLQHGQRQGGLLLRQCALPHMQVCCIHASRVPDTAACAGDIGLVHYGPRHPMKPIRLDMTHHLIVGYGLHKHMEVYVRPAAWQIVVK